MHISFRTHRQQHLPADNGNRRICRRRSFYDLRRSVKEWNTHRSYRWSLGHIIIAHNYSAILIFVSHLPNKIVRLLSSGQANKEKLSSIQADKSENVEWIRAWTQKKSSSDIMVNCNRFIVSQSSQKHRKAKSTQRKMYCTSRLFFVWILLRTQLLGRFWECTAHILADLVLNWKFVETASCKKTRHETQRRVSI